MALDRFMHMTDILDSIMTDDARRNSMQYHQLMDEVSAWPMLSPFMRAMRMMCTNPIVVSLICQNLLEIHRLAPPCSLRPLTDASREFCLEMAQGGTCSSDQWQYEFAALQI